MTIEDAIQAKEEGAPVILNMPYNISLFIECRIESVSLKPIRAEGLVASCKVVDRTGCIMHVRAQDLRRKEALDAVGRGTSIAT